MTNIIACQGIEFHHPHLAGQALGCTNNAECSGSTYFSLERESRFPPVLV